MKFRILFIVIYLAGISINVIAQETEIECAIELLSKKKYKKLYKRFSPEMKSQITLDEIERVWIQTSSQLGGFKNYSNVKTQPNGESMLQTALLEFGQFSMELQLSVDKEERISGLFISPLGYEPPSYAEGLVVGKQQMDIKVRDLKLPGELVIPRSCENCPVVILVHGSGPNDKDETIGPNKVFLDLAMGLASKGIATYRYDKRFNTYPQEQLKSFTLYEETIEDALVACRMLKSDTSLHFSKYVVLGHSLGAYAAPQIADSLPWLDGTILFSANARRLEDLIFYQYDYLGKMQGMTEKQLEKQAKDMKVKVDRIKNKEYVDSTSKSELLAYWPGSFWNSIHNYDPVETVKLNSDMNYFILQGEKDYQITMVDYAIWQKEVGDKSNVKMMSFPGLTHLFTPGTSENPGPTDYMMPGNVDEQIIFEIADWVRFLGK